MGFRREITTHRVSKLGAVELLYQLELAPPYARTGDPLDLSSTSGGGRVGGAPGTSFFGELLGLNSSPHSRQSAYLIWC